jgi:hypothetical protein
MKSCTCFSHCKKAVDEHTAGERSNVLILAAHFDASVSCCLDLRPHFRVSSSEFLIHYKRRAFDLTTPLELIVFQESQSIGIIK